MTQGISDSLLATIKGVLDPHGPAAEAVAKSFAPGDFSVHFFLQLAIIILACRVVGKLGQKYLGQPQVVGEMIAGVILGPSLFGLLFPDAQAAVFCTPGRNWALAFTCFWWARRCSSITSRQRPRVR
jgi:hypothetical protein